MAMTRNQRRLASKLREARRECDAYNSALVVKRREIIRANLGTKGKPERSPRNMGNRRVYDGSLSHRGYVCNNVSHGPNRNVNGLWSK